VEDKVLKKKIVTAIFGCANELRVENICDFTLWIYSATAHFSHNREFIFQIRENEVRQTTRRKTPLCGTGGGLI
jgi:hypothetical protein